MKTGASGFGLKYCLLCIFLCLGPWFALECANGQTTPASSGQNDGFKQGFDLKVAVEEVRIDAVVLDRSGHQVKDLTAKDFEVYQDGKPKQIMACAYVNEEQAPSRKLSKTSILTSSPMLPRDRVRRTLAFVVDDLSMDFDHFSNARKAIEKFVETQMQPYDLVVIFQTSGGALLQFSSDREVLLSRVQSLRWKGGTGGMLGCGPSGCGVAPASHRDIGNPNQTESLDGDIDMALQSAVARAGNLGGQQGSGVSTQATNVRQEAKQQAQDYYRQALFESQMAALRYCIRTLQDMPGRKSVLFMSSVITIPESKATINAQAMDLSSDFYRNVKQKFDELADEALRAGVVIQTLDTKSLAAPLPNENMGLETQPNQPTEGYIPLSKKTGGIIVENSNFFLNGIGPAAEELKGYYLISFIPPPNAFSDVRSNVYHRIQIKVKRHGTEVHTRDGYLGAPPHANPNPESAASTNTLEQAIVSPFRYNDLKLDLASGYAFAPTPGYFLRSWLQLEGKDLNFANQPDGAHFLSLELVSLTSNSDGLVQDTKALQYRFKVNDEDISRIRKEGVDFNIYLPVKNSGDYYVRTAIRDMASGKIGSAYQFLQIPDLKKPRLALSSIFVINQDEEASDIKAGNIEAGRDASDSGRKLHETKSPALRSYLPGEGFGYLTMVYDAKNKEGLQPNLESQVTIFKDGEKYFEGKREDVDLHGVGDLGRIPIMKRLVFESGMKEGAYLLQLTVRDKQNKSRTASQAIDFEIRKEQ